MNEITHLHEEMRINDYLALTHQDDRDKTFEEIRQRIRNRKITTDEEMDRAFLKDMRCNKTKPKIGKVSPLIHYSQEDTQLIGSTEIPTIQVTIKLVMIVE